MNNERILKEISAEEERMAAKLNIIKECEDKLQAAYIDYWAHKYRVQILKAQNEIISTRFEDLSINLIFKH